MHETISEFPNPLLQSATKCEAFDLKMILYTHANKTDSHKKGLALSLALN